MERSIRFEDDLKEQIRDPEFAKEYNKLMKEERKKMKLYKVVSIFECYVLAENRESARSTAHTNIEIDDITSASVDKVKAGHVLPKHYLHAYPYYNIRPEEEITVAELIERLEE